MSKSKLREEYEARFGAVDGELRLYDAKGNEIYREGSNGWWVKREYDEEGRRIYYESSGGLWWKREYDAGGNMVYCEASTSGVALDNKPYSERVFIDEKTGKKFKMVKVWESGSFIGTWEVSDD